jgi:hypothetical protein
MNSIQHTHSTFSCGSGSLSFGTVHSTHIAALLIVQMLHDLLQMVHGSLLMMASVVAP